jgi:hypothetical protein
MKGGNGMDWSISSSAPLRDLDSNIVERCIKREKFRTELLKLELESLKARLRSA